MKKLLLLLLLLNITIELNAQLFTIGDSKKDVIKSIKSNLTLNNIIKETDTQFIYDTDIMAVIYNFDLDGKVAVISRFPYLTSKLINILYTLSSECELISNVQWKCTENNVDTSVELYTSQQFIVLRTSLYVEGKHLWIKE